MLLFRRKSTEVEMGVMGVMCVMRVMGVMGDLIGLHSSIGNDRERAS